MQEGLPDSDAKAPLLDVGLETLDGKYSALSSDIGCTNDLYFSNGLILLIGMGNKGQ